MTVGGGPGDVTATAELTVAISQAMATLFSTAGAHESLAEVMAISVADIEACDLAAVVTMDEDGLVSTPAYSDRAVSEIGFIQSPPRGGPLINALVTEAALYAADLADGSWSDMAQEAAEAGVRGLLMLPLDVHPQPSALALLARYPFAFGVVDRARSLLMAHLAGVALNRVTAADEENRVAGALQDSLGIRELIGQAQGMLMEREHIAADQAFDLLRRASTDLNMKTRDVARAVVELGEWPDPRRTPRGDYF